MSLTSGDDSCPPRRYHGVMVSSCFLDLQQHRAALMKAIEGHGLHALAMEQDSALPAGNVIDSSLRKVRDAAAYVGIISHRYGETPASDLNPEGLSLTELEFREARRLGRPILIFIMSREHEVKPDAVETDPGKIRKLALFREEAKRANAGSGVQRVYKEFDSPVEFAVAAMQSVGELRRLFDAEPAIAAPAPRPHSGQQSSIPTAPALYAEPRYVASHVFVGRTAQLETLSDWAAKSDSHSVLLFEAIGGTGKSMLTWEWTTNHALGVRGDWAGRFWYSFYEKGAVMADFCRRALAYMTGRPVETFYRSRQPELTELLLRELQARPWLLVLDGLERVLVAYHRYDAAQLADEDAGSTDEIARRDPRAAIHPEDDELLRQLAGAGPSKVLITSRLVPRVLLNSAGQPIPGAMHDRLPGLRPPEAEALLRACGVHGDSGRIQAYLQRHCDCHPLVTGIVAGLVNDYLPHRGVFDFWAADPDAGGRLNLADLDLVQKRNHILQAALDTLSDDSRQLLSILALLPEAIDYHTLSALNPHRPPEPEAVPKPALPEDNDLWEGLPQGTRQRARQQYVAAVERHEHYLGAYQNWSRSPEVVAASRNLNKTIQDLERRGLLQYDRQANRYDLHPVVRGIASAGITADDRDHLGQRLVDHFSQRPRDPYEQATTLDDLRDSLIIIRTYLRMGRTKAACFAYLGLSETLLSRLEEYTEVVSLLRPFFGDGWGSPPADLSDMDTALLRSNAAVALEMMSERAQALALHQAAMRTYLSTELWTHVAIELVNLSTTFEGQNQLAKADSYSQLALELAELTDGSEVLFSTRLVRFARLARSGHWAEAERLWSLLDPMGRNWSRHRYQPGEAELCFAQFQFYQGRLADEHLAHVERLARDGRSRSSLHRIRRLRGRWLTTHGEWEPAAECLRDAIRLAHEAGLTDPESETLLALARFHLGELTAPRQDAARLAAMREPVHLALAELWKAIGEREQATAHTLAAYRRAWADGEPHVRRHSLEHAAALLRALDAEVPELPAFDRAQQLPDNWGDDIEAVIARLRARPTSATRT